MALPVGPRKESIRKTVNQGTKQIKFTGYQIRHQAPQFESRRRKPLPSLGTTHGPVANFFPGYRAGGYRRRSEVRRACFCELRQTSKGRPGGRALPRAC
jgi:hypothetical protein